MKALKILGYTLLFISCVAWAVLPLLPFLPGSGEELTALAAGVFIFAEVTWWLAIPLLGKEIIDLIKSAWPRFRQVLRQGLKSHDQKHPASKQSCSSKVQAEKIVSSNSSGGV